MIIDKTVSRPCPNCERLKKKRSWVKKTKDNKYYCPQCGSNYSSLDNIKEILKNSNIV